ncbi:hypothetical protein [Paenibacillus polymyxa]|uniref:hypothetical protein n=1 Tax=Paenibacillus polymyxa TaxID=1406 RepID=UPI002ED424CD
MNESEQCISEYFAMRSTSSAVSPWSDSKIEVRIIRYMRQLSPQEGLSLDM